MDNWVRPASQGKTDRFLTTQLNVVDRDIRFNALLTKEIRDFVAENPPLRENINFGLDTRNLGIDTKRPLNTRNLQPNQITQLREIHAKTAIQILAEGKVKTLIEKSIIEGYGQRQNLDRIISEFAKLYGFSIETNDLLKQMIETYFVNQPRVEDFFATRGNDPKRIFKDLFGVDMSVFGPDNLDSPTIRIYKGPAGVELFCSQETINKVYKYISGSQTDVLGFAHIKNVNINGVNFPIFYNFNTNEDPETYFHELGHNWNRMFKYLNQVKEFQSREEHLNGVLDDVDSKRDPKSNIEKYYESTIHQALINFGDECLAKLKSNDTFNDFFDFSNPKCPYDYLRGFRESTSNSLNISQDEYYLRKFGHTLIATLDQPTNISPATHKLYQFDRNQMIKIRNDLFNEKYVKLAREITDKITQILTKKPDIRNNLIGTLGLYTEIELWPDILDKLISEL